LRDDYTFEGWYRDENFVLIWNFDTDVVNTNITLYAKWTTERHSGEPEMLFVEGGTFWMGSESGGNSERPAHQVTLSSFSIGKYEITQEQWTSIMGTTVVQQRDLVNPSIRINGEGDNYPMCFVSWNDIVGTTGSSMLINGITYYSNGFIYKLNQLTGKNYRLPTEAEWEYAARGGNKNQGYEYSGSNNVDDVAVHGGNNSGTGRSKQPVGTKMPNELGIYDMSGNVSEFCSDWFSESYYSFSPGINPLGPSEGSRRVQRGGNVDQQSSNLRVFRRINQSPNNRDAYWGFRLAL